jgi:hypothetical protein
MVVILVAGPDVDQCNVDDVDLDLAPGWLDPLEGAPEGWRRWAT